MALVRSYYFTEVDYGYETCIILQQTVQFLCQVKRSKDFLTNFINGVCILVHNYDHYSRLAELILMQFSEVCLLH